jgi:hypothetical protein
MELVRGKCNSLKFNVTTLKKIACETDETRRRAIMKHGRRKQVTQFQFEPTVTTRESRHPQRQSRFASAKASVHAAIDSLMLGLRLRGWLTDDDKELLDRLAAGNYLTFLIKGEKYLHPEGLDLFPLDLIQTARPEAAGALFKHHYQPKTDRHCGGYVVHSAFINEEGSEPITLGMFGGSRPSNQSDAESYFAELVERFRIAAHRAEQSAADLGNLNGTDNPVLIVDRCSGRLFFTNPSADSLLNADGRPLVGIELHQMKQRLIPLADKYRWTLKNFDPQDRLYTVISLQAITHSDDGSGADSAGQFFVHKMRNKIAGITTAASHLRTLSAEQEAHEALEMAELIVGEAGQLNDLLSYFHVWSDYGSLPRRKVDVSTLLDETIDQETAKLASEWHISNETSNDDFVLKESVPALRSLFGSILRTHLGTAEQVRSGSLTTIRSADLSHSVVRITSSKRSEGGCSPMRSEWKKCADELASIMAASLTWEESEDGKSLTTILTLTK